MIRQLVSALCWWAAASLCELAVKVNPPPIRRVLEVDGATLIPAAPKREEYARVLSAYDAAWVAINCEVAICRPEVRA
jgi:hypothetical protein